MRQIGLRDQSGTEDAAIGRLMYDAIHNGPSQYTSAQRQAWLATPNAGPAWTERLAAQHVVVAREAGELLGFMTLQDDYIDLAFVAAAAQGQGLFRALFGAIEAQARACGQSRLWTHASLMAQPAFRAMGFHVIRHETVARAGQELARAEMEKKWQ